MTTATQKLLPNPPLDGHIGFYPCKPDEWQTLPLPLRCSTAYPINKKFVSAVVFDVWFENYKFQAAVEVHPANAFKALFCLADGGTQLYSVSGVRWNDGSHSGAKWWQDNQTGAYRIAVGGGRTALEQGGYQGHIPANCEYDEAEQKWKHQGNPHSDKKTYSCLV